MDRRGKTFSPALDWFDGGAPFAFEKLFEVAEFLIERGVAAEQGSRRRRNKNRQLSYDFADAAATITDAIRFIDPDGRQRASNAT